MSFTGLLTTYDFNQNTIRVVEIDVELWFHATDVLKSLGLSVVGGTTMWMTILNEDEKMLENKTTLNLAEGWSYRAWIISESAQYKLVVRSDSPLAKPFQDWVTRVVLPAIRKEGPTRDCRSYRLRPSPAGTTRSV